MAQWQWQHREGLTFLGCDLLAPWTHGFFTQASWPQKPRQLTAAIAPTAAAYQVKQVHGNQVVATAELAALSADAEPTLTEADGLLACGANQAVWTCSADCTPALVGDVATGRVAAIHAGWRGTAAQILPVAIAQFQAQGSQLQDLRVALGPAIDGTVYQVDAAIALQLGKTVMDEATAMAVDGEAGPGELDPNAVLTMLQTLPEPPILPDSQPGKLRLDVRRINLLQLLRLGLQPEQVAIAPHCTYQEPEQFFSYRRTGEKKVQWSGIVSR